MGNTCANSQKIQDDITALKEKNKRLKKQVQMYKSYEKKINHVNDVLNAPEAIVEAILGANSFDNNEECEYIIDIVKFIREACQDLNCGRISSSSES